jgi:hypothetical protein
MSDNDNSLQPLKRFRLLVVRMTMLVTFAVVGIAWFHDPRTAQGVLLGGIAGVLGFWIIAIRLEKLVHMNPDKVKFAALTWSAYRFALYGAALYKSFTLDRETYHGLIGGLIGIMIIRVVLVIVGVAGLDQRTAKEATPVTESIEESDKPDS